MPDNISTDQIESPEKSSFILAEQGNLEIIELMGAADRLKSAGLKEQTIALYRLWLENTTSPLAYVANFNLGVELASDRQYSLAEAAYARSIEQNPKFIRSRLNLGNCLEQQKRDDEALEQWRLSLETESVLLPENQALRLHALNNMGRLYEVKKNYKDSLDKLEESFAVDPTQKDVLLHLVHLIQKMCRWPVFVPPKGITKDEMIAGTSPLAMLAASDDPKLQLAAAQQFIEHKYPKLNPEPLAPKGGYKHEKIRIGYLSSDFCLHAVSLLMVELLELHNHDQFEIYGFCWSRVDDTSIQRRVQKSMDHYIKIGEMSDKEAADCIRSHEIDIMVDLQGLTSGARPLILSHRPALLQVTYLGFPGTTGLPWIDYVISDKYLIPEELAPFHTEKPLYMPNCFQSSDSKREVGPMPTRADNGLPEKAFVFCSFNNNYKFTPEVFASWMRILKRVPKSVFWLLADNEWSKENLLKEAKKLGIKKDRLIFAPRVAPADYLARYQLADLFLDTFPFNGGTTANDALFMGLPLLTLSGRTFASRMAGSLLTHLELPELITTTLKDYEEKAVRFAKHPAELKVLKDRLKKNKTEGPVFDIPLFVKGYENAIAKTLEEQTTFAIQERSLEKNVNSGEIKLYTIVYSDESKANVEDGYLMLDHLKNERSDWREYSPIRCYLLNESLQYGTYYGFFSPKFSTKTGLTHTDVLTFMKDRTADVYTFSPQPDMGAFFLNTFEQNDVFDPGFKVMSQELFNLLGLEINLDSIIMDSRHIVYSNYIVARKDFWLEWLKICEKIYQYVESVDSKYSKWLNAPTTYQGVHRKVFLIERIASLLLKTRSWKIQPYDTFKCAWSALGTSRFKDEAVISDALKFAHNELKHDEYLSGFAAIRRRVFLQK
ncbi:MAG: tetratricopeptide repeat protein [Desulfuromonadaceae bacterium]|nr:tetratricopeptide repeat protein [Desulfuromonadaceae bacterium]